MKEFSFSCTIRGEIKVESLAGKGNRNINKKGIEFGGNFEFLYGTPGTVEKGWLIRSRVWQ